MRCWCEKDVPVYTNTVSPAHTLYGDRSCTVRYQKQWFITWSFVTCSVSAHKADSLRLKTDLIRIIFAVIQFRIRRRNRLNYLHSVCVCVKTLNTEFRVCIQILSLCLYQCAILCIEIDNCVFLIQLFMFNAHALLYWQVQVHTWLTTSKPAILKFLS